MVVLHGGTGNAYAAKYLTEPNMAQQYPAYILVPMASHGDPWILPKAMFARTQHLPHVMDLIAALIDKYAIDKERIYIIGCSLGGHGVFGASEFYDDVFAAGISISGSWKPSQAHKMTKMPLLVMAGSYDKTVAVGKTKNMVGALEDARASVQYIEYDMGYNCPSSRLYTKDIWDWLFLQ